jgi:hypothetical protein
MKGNYKILEHFNLQLTEELTVVNKNIVHAEMCDNWEYDKLHTLLRYYVKYLIKCKKEKSFQGINMIGSITYKNVLIGITVMTDALPHNRLRIWNDISRRYYIPNLKLLLNFPAIFILKVSGYPLRSDD